MRGRLLLTGYSDGATNMAVDEMLLLDACDIVRERYCAILRLYGWLTPTLSLGYFQSSSIVLKSIEENNKKSQFPFEVVRRLTGGGTVLHDVEITYSFIVSEKNPLIPKNVSESYKIISQGIVNGLRKLGIETEFLDIKNQEKSYSFNKYGFCFANPSKYDILVGRKKLVGSAQRRKEGIILQHGSIILDIDREKDHYLLENGISCFSEAISLTDILGRKIDFDNISKILVEGFNKAWDIDFENERLTTAEVELAESLRKNKYSKKEWTNI